MKRVAGVGGIFFMPNDAATLREWYRRHLDIAVEACGGTALRRTGDDNPGGAGTTLWSVRGDASTYFAPRTARFMIKDRVDDLHALLAAPRAEGCDVDAKVDASKFGKFGWAMDPDGKRVELWQPPPGR